MPTVSDLRDPDTRAAFVARGRRRSKMVVNVSGRIFNRVQPLLSEIESTLLSQVAMSLRDRMTGVRTDRAIQKVDTINRKLQVSLRDEIRRGLNESIDEATSMAVKDVAFGAEFGPVARPTRLSTVKRINGRPVLGIDARVWLQDLESKLTGDLRRVLRASLVADETPPEALRSISGTSGRGFADGILSRNRRRVRQAIRTLADHVINQAREQVFLENRRRIGTLYWISIGDGRKDQVCAKLEGQTLKVGEGIRPPAHINCRSVLMPLR